jgi:hypothetical protein
MRIKRSLLKPLCAAAMLCAAAAAQADITVYTSQAAFLAAVSAPGVDTFDDVIGPQPEPDDQLNRTAGAYTYDVYSFGGLFGANGATSDHWLSNNYRTSPIVFSNFSGGVNAFGGNFFGLDEMGGYTLGNVVITAIDGGVLTYELNDAAFTGFFGFVSSTPLAAITLNPGFDTPYAAANNLVLAVPEPATWGMLLAGLGLLGAIRRKNHPRGK